MAELLTDYGLFLLEAVTIVAAILVVIAAGAAIGRRATAHEGLEVESLNKKYRTLAAAIRRAILDKSAWKAAAKAEKARDKRESKSGKRRPRVFVLDFKGDLKASAVGSLRQEIGAILEVAGPDDQVVVRLENYGGVVHEHGLGGSQLARIRSAKLPLTVCVDKVAASGGYLMACVADRIVAAPFAILGSIGVIAQLPNFNRLMDGHGIDWEMITAGEYKRNVTMFGRNTDADRAKLKAELEDVHELFKSAVATYRPNLDLGKVATGEHWYGTRALDLGLADELKTSDELLAELAEERDLYRVSYKTRKHLKQRLLANVDDALERAEAAGWRRRFESRLPRL
ncbi:MAG TPA: protease SohB [Woeseiaceae bacterium]|nr:protease SohB [Woeseiaceae bacterium]